MKKRFKKYSLIITMVSLVLIASSSLIYARFYRQYNPEVSPFAVSVSSQDNIMVSPTGVAGTFKDAIQMGDLVTDTRVSLSPLVGKVTVTADETFEVLTLNTTDTHKYLAFDLYFIGSSDMNLYLKGSRGGEVVVFDDSNVAHHFTTAEKNKLMDNLRIGFSTYSTTYQKFGPVYSEFPVETNIYATSKITTDNYSTFTDLGYSQTDRDTILATTKKNEVTKMRVVIWLEENDLGTLQAICDLTLSLRFEAVPINK